jgi:hypothetical protein
MPTRKLTIDMNALLDAMTLHDDGPTEAFLDIETGKVLEVPTEEAGDDGEDGETNARRRLVEDDPRRYVEVARVEATDELALMRRFTEALDEEDIREKLDAALRGKRAYHRFLDVVCTYADLEAAWDQLRREALVDEATRWLARLGIEPIYQLRPLPAPVRPPISQRSGLLADGSAKVSLLDLLLLGAPDAKTELIDGRVLRQVHAPSTTEARTIYKNIARDLCALNEIPWRKRHIERDTFEHGRVRLSIEDRLVELTVDVPAPLWRAFR